MLCCLSPCRSRARSSSTANGTPSIRLTIIRRYGSTAEFELSLIRLGGGQCIRRLRGWLRGRFGNRWTLGREAPAAAAIVALLLPLSGGRLIVSGAPLARTLPAMALPAANGTTQVATPCVACIGQEPNPAMRAVLHARLQRRMRLQDGLER